MNLFLSMPRLSRALEGDSVSTAINVCTDAGNFCTATQRRQAEGSKPMWACEEWMYGLCLVVCQRELLSMRQHVQECLEDKAVSVFCIC